MNIIRALRKKRKISQRELAIRSGLSLSQLQRIDANPARLLGLSLGKAVQLANVLDIPLTALVSPAAMDGMIEDEVIYDLSNKVAGAHQQFGSASSMKLTVLQSGSEAAARLFYILDGYSEDKRKLRDIFRCLAFDVGRLHQAGFRDTATIHFLRDPYRTAGYWNDTHHNFIEDWFIGPGLHEPVPEMAWCAHVVATGVKQAGNS